MNNFFQNDSLRERVYKYLNQAMSNGTLRRGVFLDQDQICQELRVSKAPLRDALIRLEAEGFVTIYPRKGVLINPITLDFIKNAYQIIGALEADCLEEVFPLLTDEVLIRFEESNQRQAEFLAAENFQQYYEENIAFHNIFLKLGSNPLLLSIITPLKQRLNDMPLRSYSTSWEKIHLEEHQRFIDSIKKHNKNAAISIFKDEHWSFEQHKQYFSTHYDFETEEGKAYFYS